MDEELKNFIIKERENAYDEYEKHSVRMGYATGYWFGYLDALNAILKEVNKPLVTLCDNTIHVESRIDPDEMAKLIVDGLKLREDFLKEQESTRITPEELHREYRGMGFD